MKASPVSLFDRLVDEALRNRHALAPLRAVVEKELLHHDILRVLSDAGLLAHLTFIGDTCLRACYGSNRLSEDLDFTGGAYFTRASLAAMSQVLIDNLKAKYGLLIEVSEPTRVVGNVDTWKLKVQTRPERKDLAAQRVNIDVCAIPSYQAQPRVLLNPYGVEMGTSGLIVQAQSREEIFADKILAFALRPNWIKNRDLWDIGWLYQQGVKPALELVPAKLNDHRVAASSCLQLLEARRLSMHDDAKIAADFKQEMRRFLPQTIVADTVSKPEYWLFLVGLVDELCAKTIRSIQ